jgi:uncharacterized membrane protein
MAKLLENFHLALLTGVVLMLALLFGLHGDSLNALEIPLLQYIHAFLGVLWIGLLYYFNFVQIPTMPKVPAELKPAVSKYIAPAALFWFRWSAAATVLLGLILAMRSGYLAEALSLQEGYRLIGIGMWLGLIMAANVWFVIWPNQKRALGLVETDDASKARSARVAMLASRTNLVLSIPMLYAMTTYTPLQA